MIIDDDDEEPEEHRTAIDNHMDGTILIAAHHFDSFIAPMTLKNIHHYLINKRVSEENVTATKPFEKGFHIIHCAS